MADDTKKSDAQLPEIKSADIDSFGTDKSAAPTLESLSASVAALQALSNRQVNLDKDIIGLFEIVTTVPTSSPRDVYDQIKIYKSGTTYRLYIYDQVNHAWTYMSYPLLSEIVTSPTVVTVAPSGTPANNSFANNIKIFSSTALNLFRFYWYDTTAGAWHFAEHQEIYHGVVAASGSASGYGIPAGWVSLKNTTGIYTIQHNLNLAAYAVLLTLDGAGSTPTAAGSIGVYAQTANQFQIATYNSSNVAADRAFNFALIKNIT